MTTTHPAGRRWSAGHLVGATRLGALRATFRVLDAVAPRAAAARAMDLWCTLPGNPGRRKDFRPGPGEIRRLAVPRGGEIVAESWGEGPVVYLVHGWGGWRGQLGGFVAPLVEAGHRVVAFDVAGHGDSDPAVMGPGKGTLPEFMEAFEVVLGAYGEASGVVAHSMGCTSAALVVRESVPTERLVLIAPNHEFATMTHDFARLLGVTERTRTRMVDGIEAFTGRPTSDFDLVPLGASGGMPPTLVVHDRLDKETPYAVGEAVAREWPDAVLLTTEGLGHQRILADQATIAAVVEHISDRVPARG